jgi:DNA (cytosine-5)-methyltransferase 1
MFPTPDTQNHRDGAKLRKDNNLKEGGMHGVSLHHYITMFPTPQANEDAAGTPQGKMQRMLGNCEEVRDSGTGVLNPTWVEWLMGYPSGWTDLKVSETQLSRTSPISSESDSKNYAKKTKPKNISPKP